MFNLLSSLYTIVIELLSGKESNLNIYERIIDLAFGRAFELLNVLAYGVSGLFFLLTGFLISYFNLLMQYDRIGTVNVGAVAIGGLVLCFIGFGILFNTSKSKIKTLKKEETPIYSHSERDISPIENALAALLLDFVKEREESRNISKNKEFELNKEIQNKNLEH
jgi:hypothetical protein